MTKTAKPSATAIVRRALAATLPEYLQSVLAQRAGRSAVAAGSRYPRIGTATLLGRLQDATWRAYQHPEVAAPARAYRTALPGRFGLVDLTTVPPSTPLRLADPKNTGFVEAEIKGALGPMVTHTTLLVGPGDAGDDIVWTFFPGEPISPSRIKTTVAWAGRQITAAHALELGFRFAKIV